MKEWTIFNTQNQHVKAWRGGLLRLRVDRGYGWKRFVGLGVSHERISYGTTYREPGTNEGRALHVFVGPYHIELLYSWKDLTENRLDDEESPIHIQTYGRGAR